MEIDQPGILVKISKFLDNQKIPYMITGAWSAIYYGRPRASHDIDFVIELSIQNLEKITEAFSKLLSEDFLLQIETIEESVKNESLFQAVYLPTMLKIDFWILTNDEFDKSRFARRKRVKILNRFMQMASPEDTVIQKLRWYRQGKIEKHLVDAAFVYQIQKKALDKKYLDFWVEKLNLKRYYQQLKKIDLDQHL